MSKTVPVDEAQNHLCDLLEEKTEFVITQDGEPVARVVPIEKRRMRSLEELRGSVRILGDIIEPIE